MDIVIRATAIFVMLWFVTRAMGKRELAEMSPFDLILLVIMGDLIQQGVTQEDRSITGAVIAVMTITFLVIVQSWLSFRSKRAQEVLDGLPVVVLRDGKPDEDLLALERLSPDDLKQQARSVGIADLRRVKIAVLESDGDFSFILDEEPDPKRVKQAKAAHTEED
jgi:uncharacterized membrane protein YcaP (DUF421 family)